VRALTLKEGTTLGKIIAIFLALLIFIPMPLHAEGSQREVIEITYFGTDSCALCRSIKAYLQNYMATTALSLESPNFLRIDITYKEITEAGNEDLHRIFSKAFSVPEEKFSVVPVIFVGDTFLIGEDIRLHLHSLLRSFYSGAREYRKTSLEGITIEDIQKEQKDAFSRFTILGVFAAGLLDGVNPCAIAMLLFFISFITASGRSDKTILYVGFSFILGTFIAYFSIGLGLFRFAYLFKYASGILGFVYGFTILMALGLAVQSFLEFLAVRRGDFSKIKLQLPKKIKHIIHNYVRKNMSNRFIYSSAFLSGIVISALEFFCTGQIYLPTIVYILSLNVSMARAASLLALYNLAFVLPLITICLSIYHGKKIVDVSHTLTSKLHFIKLAVSVFFFIVAIVMVFQLKGLW